MARNGSGVYSLPAGSTVTNGDTSDASDLNTPFSDLETDANTARPVVAGGTGAVTASAARTNLGLVIGTDVQAYSADLALLVANPLAAVELQQLQNIDTTTISAGQWGYLGGMTTLGGALATASSASAARTSLGLTSLATTTLLDEDDMASDSASAPPSQQSTKAYVDGLAVGVGQTWTDVSGSRTAGTDIQNTTGRPIMVSVAQSGGSQSTIQVGATTGSYVTLGYLDGSSGIESSHSFVVPDDHYYKVSSSGATITIWAELT